ncbi:glycoside hydrolase family 25 protein [Butyrivibrio sp. M55]|uniref:glycoside hydrolase family 25 protein n=1 Tax=Butyrivibrio sp. M55 TaxID=1855323 RepID=UPI0008E2DB54|nr:GH25 family lysozyme [Butyrivibrio sp. M55]SFU61375.1 Glycosyl hydrolases family 25 [Butyrivibrio sp. M55]
MKKITKRGLFVGRKTSKGRKKRDNREYREEYDRDVRDDREYDGYDDYVDDRGYDDRRYDREYEVFDDNRDYKVGRDYDDYDYDRDYEDNKDYVDSRKYSDAGYDYDRRCEKEDYDRDYADDDRDYENGDDYGHGYADDDRYYSNNARSYDDEVRGYERMIDEKYDDSDYDRDYADDDRDYAEDDRQFKSADLASAFNGDNEYDTRYCDSDYEYDGGYDDRYDNEEYSRGHKASKKGARRSGKTRKSPSAVERTAAVVAVVILGGAIATGVFYTKALGRSHEISAFADVGSTMSDVQIVGQSGLVAVADAEKAKQMTANIIDEAKEEKVEEVVEEKVEEEVTGGKVSFSVSSIKSDLKIKFIGSNKKLVAKVPFKVTVENPDGSKVDYEDDDKDGIIYKKEMKAGTYKVTPNALPAEYSQYSLDTSTKSVTVKDKVEMKPVDVSNEVKKESQINVAKEDTAVKNVVESTLKDTVEYVESEKIPADGSAADKNGTYKEIDKNSIADPMSQSSIIDFTNFRTVARARENNATGDLKTNGEAETNNTSQKDDESNKDDTLKSGEDLNNPNEDSKKKSEDEEAAKKAAEEAKKKADEEAAAKKKADEEAAAAEASRLKKEKEEAAAAEASRLKKEQEEAAAAEASRLKQEADKKALLEKNGKVPVKETAITLTEGDKKAIETKVSGLAIQITSDNTGCVSCSGNTISAIAKGTAKLTVTAENYQTEYITVTVNAKKAGDLPIKFKKITLVQDEKTNIGINANDYPGFSGKAKDASIVGVSGTELQGKKAGKTTVTYTATGYNAFDIEVTVVDKKALLKTRDGEQVYVKSSEGGFREATYADYYNKENFFLKDKGEGNFKYKGWQTINGKTYYYNKNCEYVTGKQVIQGVEYVFGSDGVLTTSAGARGIDVSKWNGSIDWKAVRNEGIEFAIIRCGYRGSSQGALIEDPTFRTNIKGAQAAGLKVGVYFFTQAVNEAEAVEEASMVIELCKGYGLSFPVYLDVEGSNGRGDTISAEQRTANIKAFCGTIQNAGYKAGVYANKTWFTSKINTNQITNYKIWLAQYAANPTYNATRFDMWQHTSKGKVSGISGNVDLNILYR